MSAWNYVYERRPIEKSIENKYIRFVIAMFITGFLFVIAHFMYSTFDSSSINMSSSLKSARYLIYVPKYESITRTVTRSTRVSAT
jgi:hypothetical protein